MGGGRAPKVGPLRGCRSNCRETRPSSVQGCLYKVNCVARQGESPSGERGSSGGEGPLEERVPWGTACPFKVCRLSNGLISMYLSAMIPGGDQVRRRHWGRGRKTRLDRLAQPGRETKKREANASLLNSPGEESNQTSLMLFFLTTFRRHVLRICRSSTVPLGALCRKIRRQCNNGVCCSAVHSDCEIAGSVVTSQCGDCT